MNKKLTILSIGIGVIIVSSFSIGFMVSTLINNPIDNTKLYIAIDDIWFTKYGSTPDYYYDNIRPDMNSLMVGGGNDGTANPSYSVAYIRFDLRNKPSSWEKCEISLYEYSFYKMSDYVVGFRVDLFEGDWNETSGNTEVYWKIERVSMTLGYSVGFKKLDITNYIKNNNTISMRIYVSVQNKWKGTIRFYSSEWDGIEPDFPYILPENDSYNNYLPQLIWS